MATSDVRGGASQTADNGEQEANDAQVAGATAGPGPVHGNRTFKDIVRSIRYACRKKGNRFCDDLFKPSDRRINKDPQHLSHNFVHTWHRPESIQLPGYAKGTPWEVFDVPEAACLRQGQLGDCWILAIMSLLSYHKYLLYEIFITRKANAEGVYAMRLCVGGEWRNVIVDDRIPCMRDDTITFCHVSDKQLWVPLLEKGVAKYFGSYGALSSGFGTEGMTLFTGYTSEEVNMAKLNHMGRLNNDWIWQMLTRSLEVNFLVTVGTGLPPNKLPNEYVMYNLPADHGYSVLQAIRVGGNRLIRLRNPYKIKTWTGKWCEGSPAWQSVHPAQLQNVDLGGSNDGIYWMALEDFCRYYMSMFIGRVREGWAETRITKQYFQTSDDPFINVSTLEVTKRTDVDISCHQRTIRGTKCKRYIDTTILLFDNVWHLRASVTSDREGRTNLFLTLDPGNYNLMFSSFNRWNDHQHRYRLEHTVLLHSRAPINFRQRMKDSDLTAEALIKFARARGSRIKRDAVGLMSLYTVGFQDVLYVVMAENIHPTYQFLIKSSMNSCQNLQLTRKGTYFEDHLPPYSSQILHVGTDKVAEHRALMRPSYHAYYTKTQVDEVCDERHFPELSEDDKVLHRNIKHLSH